MMSFLEQLWRSRCFVGVNPWHALSPGLFFCEIWNMKMRVLLDSYLLRNLDSEIMLSQKFILEQVHAVLITRAFVEHLANTRKEKNITHNFSSFNLNTQCRHLSLWAYL